LFVDSITGQELSTVGDRICQKVICDFQVLKLFWVCLGLNRVSLNHVTYKCLLQSKLMGHAPLLKPQHTSHAGWVGTVKMGMPMLKLQRSLSSGTCCSFRPHPCYYCCWSSTEDTNLSSQYSDLLLHLIPKPDPISSRLWGGGVKYS